MALYSVFKSRVKFGASQHETRDDKYKAHKFDDVQIAIGSKGFILIPGFLNNCGLVQRRIEEVTRTIRYDVLA